MKPERAKLTKNAIGRKRAEFWWRYGSTPKNLRRHRWAWSECWRSQALVNMPRSPAYQSDMVYSPTPLIVFPFDTYAAFCALQSRPHEIWARFFGSSLKDDLRYTPSDCFETYPFPKGLGYPSQPRSRWRGLLRVSRPTDGCQQRGHDQDLQPLSRPPTRTICDIAKLRELHAAMDRTLSSTPTAGTKSRPTATSCSTTRSTKRSGVIARNPIATAGPTRCETMCWRGSSN